MRGHLAVLAVALLAALPHPAPAQVVSDTSRAAPLADMAGRLACEPALTARAWVGGGISPVADAGAGAPDSRLASARDTVIMLAIADRTWTRDDVHAGVALGASGVAGAQAAPWRTCAGATAHLGRVTARLRNVYGTVRLHVDPGSLNSIGRATPPVPPAGPPRR